MALIEKIRKQGDFLFRYRSYFPLLFLLAGIFIFVYNVYYNNYNYSSWYYWVCFGVSFFGLAIRGLTIGYVPKNTSGRNTQRQVADVVNTTGMYSLVRHPLYFGNFFMWFGLALLTQNIWFILFFIVVFWLYYERIMYAEEFFLREKFGELYTNWADSVPTFIPRIKGWKSPKTFFSFKNVVKREALGLFKLVLIFFLFQYLYDFIASRCNDFSLSYWGKVWLIILIVTTVFYLTIRTIRKNSHFLDVEGR